MVSFSDLALWPCRRHCWRFAAILIPPVQTSIGAHGGFGGYFTGTPAQPAFIGSSRLLFTAVTLGPTVLRGGLPQFDPGLDARPGSDIHHRPGLGAGSGCCRNTRRRAE